MAEGVQGDALFPVALNIYDLSQGMARQLSLAFLGTSIDAIYHTGVVVYGQEYWFGMGIERGVPGRTYFGRPLRTLKLGDTAVTEEIFEEFLQGIGPQFNAGTYSLLRNNCNHFSDEVAQFLVGSGIPKDIVDLPNVVLNTPQGQLLANMLQGMENQLRNGMPPQPTSPLAELRPLPLNPAPASTSIPAAVATTKAASPSPRVPCVSVRTESPAHSGEAVNAKCMGNPEILENDSNARGRTSSAEGPSLTSSAISSRSVAEKSKKALEDEIKREFAVLMALGTLGANEAAAEALKRVVARRNSAATKA